MWEVKYIQRKGGLTLVEPWFIRKVLKSTEVQLIQRCLELAALHLFVYTVLQLNRYGNLGEFLDTHCTPFSLSLLTV